MEPPKRKIVKIQHEIIKKESVIDRIDSDISMIKDIIKNNKYIYYKSTSNLGVISVDSDLLYKNKFLLKLVEKKKNILLDINYFKEQLNVFNGVNAGIYKKKSIEREIESIATNSIKMYDKTKSLLKKNSDFYDAISGKLDLIEESLTKNTEKKMCSEDTKTKINVKKKEQNKKGSFISRIFNGQKIKK